MSSTSSSTTAELQRAVAANDYERVFSLAVGLLAPFSAPYERAPLEHVIAAGVAAARLEKHEAAVQYLEAVVHRDGNHARALSTLADVYSRLPAAAVAPSSHLATLRRLLPLVRDSKPARFGSAALSAACLVYEHEGDRAASIALLRDAVQVVSRDTGDLALLHFKLCAALVTAEESHLAAATGDALPLQLKSTAVTVLQAQRMLIMACSSRMPTSALPDAPLAALIQRHVQLAGDRVKVAACLPLHEPQPAPTPTLSSLACNSNSSDGFMAFKLAADKLVDIAIFSLKLLLPAWTAAGFKSSSASSWSTLPAHIRTAAQAAVEVTLVHAWPVLQLELCLTLAATLNALAPTSPVAVMLQAYCAACDALPTPQPELASSPRTTSTSASAYASQVKSVSSQVDSTPLPVRYACPWMCSLAAAVATGMTVADRSSQGRSNARSNAIALMRECIQVVCGGEGRRGGSSSYVLPAAAGDVALHSIDTTLPLYPAARLVEEGEDSGLRARPPQLDRVRCVHLRAAAGSYMHTVLHMQLLALQCRDVHAMGAMQDTIHALTPVLSAATREPVHALFLASTAAHVAVAQATMAAEMLSWELDSGFVVPRARACVPAAHPLLVKLKHAIPAAHAASQTLMEAIGASIPADSLMERSAQACTATLRAEVNIAASVAASADNSMPLASCVAEAEAAVDMARTARQRMRPSTSPLAQVHDSVSSSLIAALSPYLHACAMTLHTARAASPVCPYGLDDASLARALGVAAHAHLMHNTHKAASDCAREAAHRDWGNARAVAVIGLWCALGDGDALLQDDAVSAHTRDISVASCDTTTARVDEVLLCIGRSPPCALPSSALPRACTPRKPQLLVKCWQEAVGVRPDEPYAAIPLMEHYSLAGDAARASAVCQRALDVNPRAQWAWMRLASLSLSAGLTALSHAHMHVRACDVIAHAYAAGTYTRSAAYPKSSPPLRSVGTRTASGVANDDAHAHMDEHMSSSRALSDAAGRDLTLAVAAYHRALAPCPGALAPGAVYSVEEASMATPSVTAQDAAQGTHHQVSLAMLDATARCWRGLALAYRAQGRHTAACRAAETSVCVSSLSPHGSASVPACTLTLLGECYVTLSDYDRAVTAFHAALTLQPHDVSTLYALACVHRSLARRRIGDGAAIAGMAHVRAGISAVLECLRALSRAEGDTQHAHASPYVDLTAARVAVALATSSTADVACDDGIFAASAPAPVWRVLGDLFSCVYDAVPHAYGWVALAACTHTEFACDFARMASCASQDMPATGVFEWLLALLPGMPPLEMHAIPSVLGDSAAHGGATHSSALGARLHAITEHSALVAYAARGAALAHGRCVDELTSAAANAQAKPLPSGADTFSRETYAGGVVAACCDLGRVLYLESLSAVCAAGSTGLLLALPHHSRGSISHVRTPLMHTLKYAAALRRVSAAAHSRAIVVDPGCARAWNGLGVVEAEPLTAQHAFVRCIQLGGGGIALVNLGALYVQHGELELASGVLMQAQTKDPNNEAMWLTQGLIAEGAVLRGMANDDHGRVTSAFILSTDLSLHPASVLPAALHLMMEDEHARPPAVLSSADGRDAPAPLLRRSSSSIASAGVSMMADIDMFARLVGERDPLNPLALLVTARRRLHTAARTTRAVCTLFGGPPSSQTTPDLDVHALLAALVRRGLSIGADADAARAYAGAATGADPCIHFARARAAHTRTCTAAWDAVDAAYSSTAQRVSTLFCALSSERERGGAHMSASMRAAVYECRCATSYAIMMSAVHGGHDGIAAGHKAAVRAAAAVGCAGTTWTPTLHGSVVDAVSSPSAASFSHEAVYLYACALALAGEREALSSFLQAVRWDESLSLVLSLLVDVHGTEERGTSSVGARIALLADTESAGVHVLAARDALAGAARHGAAGLAQASWTVAREHAVSSYQDARAAGGDDSRLVHGINSLLAYARAHDEHALAPLAAAQALMLAATIEFGRDHAADGMMLLKDARINIANARIRIAAWARQQSIDSRIGSSLSPTVTLFERALDEQDDLLADAMGAAMIEHALDALTLDVAALSRTHTGLQDGGGEQVASGMLRTQREDAAVERERVRAAAWLPWV